MAKKARTAEDIESQKQRTEKYLNRLWGTNYQRVLNNIESLFSSGLRMGFERADVNGFPIGNNRDFLEVLAIISTYARPIVSPLRPSDRSPAKRIHKRLWERLQADPVLRPIVMSCLLQHCCGEIFNFRP